VARATASGACVFPACDASDAVDVDAGCIPLGTLLHGGPRTCAAGFSLVLEDRRSVCVPADAACPRGTHADGVACAHAPACPPGTLPAAGACRPIVLEGEAGSRLVDLAAWATLALGVDGGPGSADLCRPLQAHPLAWELAPGDGLPVHVRVVLSAPGNDVSRVSADVRTTNPGGGHAPPPGAVTLAEHTVASLVEPLRGLGGETTATRVEVEVRCDVGAPVVKPAH